MHDGRYYSSMDNSARNTSTIPIEQAMHLIEKRGQTDTALIGRAGQLSTRALLRIDDQLWLLSIDKGRVDSLSSGPFVMPSTQFALQAPAIEWQRFWQPLPPPGSHDLFALLKRRVLTLTGDLHPFMAHLLYFKFLLAAPRDRTH